MSSNSSSFASSYDIAQMEATNAGVFNQSLLQKPNRMKVGVRCRPAFQDEINFAKGNYMSIVETKRESGKSLGQVTLTLMNGKQREFFYDYVFGPESSQDDVYDRLAKPVVDDALRGFNGTIFAYGQTGTGKTYTMGILEFVESNHAGIIPRALSQVFEYMSAIETQGSSATIRLSFLQLYRETIQDLLSPAVASYQGSSVGDENLIIREDPQRGFYVEGLKEFVVRSYGEAEALLNLGLENRALAPTLMNSTSSRSHTVLTLTIEQKLTQGSNSYQNRTIRSKLVMVDLAGSERVRRTVSKGTRLSEAKSINTSLSALGNVIAALASSSTAHIPFRDSKLTRLLQDSLGGTATTALIATIGPAAFNYGETLSTLLFANRCLSVKITPKVHEEVNYAELCAQLQQRLSSIEADMTKKMTEQREHYETVINDLNEKLEWERSEKGRRDIVVSLKSIVGEDPMIDLEGIHGIDMLIQRLADMRQTDDDRTDNSQSSGKWKSKASRNFWVESLRNLGSDPNTHVTSAQEEILALLAYCYDILRALSCDTSSILDSCTSRENSEKNDIQVNISEEAVLQQRRDMERERFENEDPFLSRNIKSQNVKIGNHLAPLHKLDAMKRVENSYSTSLLERWESHPNSQAFLPSFMDYKGPQELAEALSSLQISIQHNVNAMSLVLIEKDGLFRKLKDELASHLVEQRKREEEVVNWSFVLKYLLSSITKLRQQVKEEQVNISQLRMQSISSALRIPKSKLSSFSPDDTNINIIDGPVDQEYREYDGNAAGSDYDDDSRRIDVGSDGEECSISTLTNSASAPILSLKSNSNFINQTIPMKQKYAVISQRATTSAAIQSQQILPSRDKETESSNSKSFAKQVVDDLGVDDESQALAAMSVVERVANITEAQLQALDPTTRAEILHIRRELGLDKRVEDFFPPNNQVQFSAVTMYPRSSEKEPSSAMRNVPKSARKVSMQSSEARDGDPY